MIQTSGPHQEQILKANGVLRDLSSLFPDYDGQHQKFTWRWSPDLWNIVPQLGQDGSIQYEVRCMCGVDIRVHQLECKGSIAKVKLSKEWLAASDGPYATYANMYVLCSWVPPPTPMEWRDAMGTDEDYPETGRYVPVSRGITCMVIPPRTGPEQYEAVSRLVARMIRENETKWREQMIESQAKKHELEVPIYSQGKKVAEPDKNKKFWDIKYRLKQASRVYSQTGTVGYSGKADLPAQ